MKRILVATHNLGKLKEIQEGLQPGKCQILGLGDVTERPISDLAPEPHNSFLANAFEKITWTLRHPHLNLQTLDAILVDDSGLCIPALGGLPGVHSSTFGGVPSNEARNNDELVKYLHKYQETGPKEGHPHLEEVRLSAYFVCFFVLIEKQNFFAWANKPLDPIFLTSLLELEKQLLNNNLSSSFHTIYCDDPISITSQRPSIKIFYGASFGWVSSIPKKLGELGHGYDPHFFPAQYPHESFATLSLTTKNSLSHRGHAMAILRREWGEGD